MFDKVFKKRTRGAGSDDATSSTPDATTTTTAPTTVAASTSPEVDAGNPTASGPGDKSTSLLGRWRDSRRSKAGEITDEELLKYTGKTRTQINEWAKDRPDVAGNQLAGKVAVGPTSGLSMVGHSAAFNGLGGLKFPPQSAEAAQAAKKLPDEDDEEDDA